MRRRPKNQDAQIVIDAVEMMRDACRNKDKTAGFDGPILTRHPNDTAAADHVVNLVLDVRSLAVGRPLWPDGQAHAELVRREEVDIPMTVCIARLRIQVRDLVGFHCRAQQVSSWLGGLPDCA